MHIAAAHGNTDIGNLLYDSNAKLDAKDKVSNYERCNLENNESYLKVDCEWPLSVTVDIGSGFFVLVSACKDFMYVWRDCINSFKAS